MLELYIERNCAKSIKKARKRGKDLNKLWSIVDKLRRHIPLDIRHRPHRLSGEWYPAWECHIEPDWLLIYHVSDKALILVDTGTHSDLFE